jgi:hypothetical protein
MADDPPVLEQHHRDARANFVRICSLCYLLFEADWTKVP